MVEPPPRICKAVSLGEKDGSKPARIYSVAAIDRAVAVLEAVAAGRDRSLSDVARAAGLDESTTLRYLSSLGSHDFIERDDSIKTYSLGLRLYRLGQQAVGSRDVRKIALSHMERLHERFEETVNLAHWRKDRLIVIDVLESQRSIRRGASIGDTDFWHASALGKCLLAVADPNAVRALLERIERPRFTEHTLVDVDDILASLPEIVSRGYAVDDEEYELGLRCVASAVRDRRGSPAYAVSISGVAARMSPEVTERAGKAVAAAASAISTTLGYVSEEVPLNEAENDGEHESRAERASA